MEVLAGSIEREETDAVVLVVSEENGAISMAYDANLIYDLSIGEVSERVNRIFEYSREEEPILEDIRHIGIFPG